MSKKRFMVVMVVVMMMLVFASPAFAQKSLFYAANPTQLASAGGLSSTSLPAHRTMITGQGNLWGVTASGDGTSAGDFALIYDDTDASGTPILEISIGTAEDTEQILLNGANFGTGIFVEANNDLVHITLEYVQ